METLDQRSWRKAKHPKVNDIYCAGKEFIEAIDKFTSSFLNTLSLEEKKIMEDAINFTEDYLKKIKEIYYLFPNAAI